MKRKTTQILLVTIILGLLFSLTGCLPKLTEEEIQELADFETTAAEYYKDKYGEIPQIESCGYYVEADLFISRTEHKYARCADETIIFYDADRDQIVDNRQSEEISTAIEKEFAAQMEQVIAPIHSSDLVILNCRSSAYAANYEGNFYHTYYEGDINAFLAAEDVQLDANMYLLCDKDDPWEDVPYKCEEIIRKNFRTDNIVTLTILSEDCFWNDTGNTSISNSGCYAKYYMTATSTDAYIKSYIKIANGIYATCAEKNFIFEDGDITAVEAISEEDLNDQLSETTTDSPYYVVSASTPIYRFKLSDRIKDLFSDGEVDVYLMYVTEEVSAAEGDKILKYTCEDGEHRCWSIAAANSEDAVRTDINEVDYFFIGSYFRESDTG